MKTILEIIQLSRDYLEQRSIAHARREAEQLIADVLGLKRLDLYVHFERPLTEEELTQCRSALLRRGKGEPSQYIRGHVDFFDCTFRVNPAVLIPRQETEILVDKIAQTLEKNAFQGKTLWDMCCGSGCIGISLKKRFPALNVVLSDISPQAIEVARENARLNAVDVECLEGDLFAPFAGRQTDYFVCNPPYIGEKEYLTLDREVQGFEPRQALVAGERGDEMYSAIARHLPQFLLPGGKAWFEVGTGQGSQVKSYFGAPCYTRIAVENDWAGHERFFFLEIE